MTESERALIYARLDAELIEWKRQARSERNSRSAKRPRLPWSRYGETLERVVVGIGPGRRIYSRLGTYGNYGDSTGLVWVRTTPEWGQPADAGRILSAVDDAAGASA